VSQELGHPAGLFPNLAEIVSAFEEDTMAEMFKPITGSSADLGDHPWILGLPKGAVGI
jgi:hypothetical protein